MLTSDVRKTRFLKVWILPFALIACMFILSGCDLFNYGNGGEGPDPEPPQPVPQQLLPLANFSVTSITNCASWTFNANANGYILNVNGQEFELAVTVTSFNLLTNDSIPAGLCSVKIKAKGGKVVGDIIYTDSEWTQELSYTKYNYIHQSNLPAPVLAVIDNIASWTWGGVAVEGFTIYASGLAIETVVGNSLDLTALELTANNYEIRVAAGEGIDGFDYYLGSAMSNSVNWGKAGNKQLQSTMLFNTTADGFSVWNDSGPLTVFWDNVSNASGFLLRILTSTGTHIQDIELNASTRSYNLAALDLISGTYTVKLQAKGGKTDGAITYTDSQFYTRTLEING